MKLGIRTKLFVVSVLVIVVSIFVSGFFLAHVQRDEIFARIETELRRHTSAAKTLIESVHALGDISRIDALATWPSPQSL